MYIFWFHIIYLLSWKLRPSGDSSVGILTRLWAEWSRNQCSIPGRHKALSFLHSVQTGSGAHPRQEISPFAQCPDWLSGPPSLLSNGYEGIFSWGLSSWGMKLFARLHVVLRLTVCEVILSIYPTCVMSWCIFKHRDSFMLSQYKKWQPSCFLFGRARVQVSTQRFAVMTKIFHGC
jgi:hypothetical protein